MWRQVLHSKTSLHVKQFEEKEKISYYRQKQSKKQKHSNRKQIIIMGFFILNSIPPVKKLLGSVDSA